MWRVLVVDDEVDIRESLRDLLEMALDIHVEVAADGQAGLEAASASHFDLIISDFKMPGMDGVEFLRRAKEAAPRTPRILVTAFPDLDVAVRAINESGVDNFFTKPLDPDQVIKVVDDTLRRRKHDVQKDQAFARALEQARKEAKRE